ncbi:MAG: hypothetical protein M1833_000926 [Piccolia ochrophora]|nr:MAG: hypothetical protein M1833_000926 [Piccolia ochrophora]
MLCLCALLFAVLGSQHLLGVTAIPYTPYNAPRFTLVAANNRDVSLLDGLGVTTFQNRLFLISTNETPSTYCPGPPVIAQCPQVPKTVFKVNTDHTMDLDVLVPGGQRVFVTRYGIAQHTPHHSPTTIEANAYLSSFTYVPPPLYAGVNEYGQFKFSVPGNNTLSPFYACPRIKPDLGGVQLFSLVVNVPGRSFGIPTDIPPGFITSWTTCWPVELKAKPYNGPVGAYEHTFYPGTEGMDWP